MSSIYAVLAAVNFVCAFIPPFNFLSVLNLVVAVWLAIAAYNEHNT